MKRVDVFKKTNDDWYPAFEMGGEKLVEVSFIQLTPWLPVEERIWRVCVWGNDDCGMERDFNPNEESHAWSIFLNVIGEEYVDMKFLLSLGFVSA